MAMINHTAAEIVQAMPLLQHAMLIIDTIFPQSSSYNAELLLNPQIETLNRVMPEFIKVLVAFANIFVEMMIGMVEFLRTLLKGIQNGMVIAWFVMCVPMIIVVVTTEYPMIRSLWIRTRTTTTVPATPAVCAR